MPFDLNEKYLRSAEEKLGARLPDSYRQAMMAANGGEVAGVSNNWYLYPILDGSDRKRIARTCNDVMMETARLRQWRGFPDRALAIADNGEGDQLLLLRSNGPFEPAVYCWSHESGELTKEADDFSQLARR